jgi:mannose-1-phosphate guanylyltransferase/mannose-6-phosphate isomerase
VRGTAEVLRDEELSLIHENESIYLPIGCMYRLSNPGKIDLELIEVQTGSYLGEDDIVRFNYVRGQLQEERLLTLDGPKAVRDNREH